MTRPGTFSRRFVLCSALLVSAHAAAQVSAPVSAPEQVPPLVKWSADVWSAAEDGNADAVVKLLKALPDQDRAVKDLTDFRAAMKLLDENQSRASASIADSREEAMSEMQAHLDADELTLALRSAIQVQDLSGDFDSVFVDEKITDLIAWARDRVPVVEGSHDWLAAQELLFLLRTLYEDTDRKMEYQHYDKLLDRVNRRVSLLAQYAPRKLHELRVAAAERSDEEPIGDFNEATAVDWRERVEDVDHRTLKGAMRIAAREHIETEGHRGWRVLIEGGLDALHVLSTTPGLDSSLEKLGDPVRREQWLTHLDNETARLARVEDEELDSWALQRIIDELLRVNERTVQLPTEVVYREFGDGAVNQFDEVYDDPYSEIIWPDKLRRFQQATEGNFVGVGILIRHDEKRQIFVVNPLEGTPAYFAGIKPDDLIMEVDHEATVGWSLNDAVDRITGPKGDTVILGVKREGHEDLIDVPVERDVIKIRTVKGWWKNKLDEDGSPDWDWFIDPSSRIAYIRLSQFTEDTYHDLRDAWSEISEEGRPNGIIVDLRYNPGGLLTSAVQISNLFVPQGLIVSGEDKYGRKAFPDQKADPRRAELFGVPTVLLVNKGSASASEIVAGCLQAHGAAVVVGEQTYGKGSVQTVHHISNDARLKLTTHYYRLPPVPGDERGRLVHKRPLADDWGVIPDIVVKMTTKQVVDSIELRQAGDIIPSNEDGLIEPDSPERPDIMQMLTKGYDPQLETALLLLQARALGVMEENARHARR